MLEKWSLVCIKSLLDRTETLLKLSCLSRVKASHLPEAVCGLLLHGRLVVRPRHGPRCGRRCSGCGGLQQSDAPHALAEKRETR